MAFKANIRQVFHLQMRAASVILDLKTREERTVYVFQKLGWIPFYNEINVNKLCLIFKSLNGQCPGYLLNRLICVKVTYQHGPQVMAILPYSTQSITEQQKGVELFYHIYTTMEFSTC